MEQTDSVVVLLSTYNGEKFLEAQLDSILNQSYSNLTVIIRDDGSTDATVSILEAYQQYDQIILVSDTRNNLGPKMSFGELLRLGLLDTTAKYFMFADQDDIWLPDKIERTLRKMKQEEAGGASLPILIHSDLRVIGIQGEEIHPSFWAYQNLRPSRDSFPRLLMQNVITGCTVMLNRQLAELCLPVHPDAIMHDWWIGLVASAFGKIGYVHEPTILYRQHQQNSVGAKRFNSRYILNKIFEPVSIEKNIKQASAFRAKFIHTLSGQNRLSLDQYIALEHASYVKRRLVIVKNGFYKIGFIRNLGLLINWK
ncbi:glycosyltransferase family 2 protein [Paenibacillus sp. FJAT-26967]|uniref:glycosyltransferase family 2 protein n=1 Tax=Paenibacillus sp. FJAT-26967 TaxID=1729690 RepID=UPI000839636B|nr:glycosyltransferase family 2 protein [Paenibacillus sp. FJAT-26967]